MLVYRSGSHQSILNSALYFYSKQECNYSWRQLDVWGPENGGKGHFRSFCGKYLACLGASTMCFLTRHIFHLQLQKKKFRWSIITNSNEFLEYMLSVVCQHLCLSLKGSFSGIAEKYKGTRESQLFKQVYCSSTIWVFHQPFWAFACNP